MKPYTSYNPLTGRVAVGLPVALPERGLVVVVEAAWGDGESERVRLDPLPASRLERAAACALAEPQMALLAARMAQQDDWRMAERWRRGCALVHRHGEMLRGGEARREGERVTA